MNHQCVHYTLPTMKLFFSGVMGHTQKNMFYKMADEIMAQRQWGLVLSKISFSSERENTNH